MPTARVALVAAVALFAIALSGCPEARDPVDRTQANAILKTNFDGEWFFQRTVVDTPYETEFTMIGDQGELERIRWRIEENALVAVRSYQRFEGSDPDRNENGDYEGNPIAAWPIVSHFDIRREYNSTTGEEYNVIVENDFDRQWFERDYIRVDWTQQLLTNWNFYAPSAVNMSPLQVAVTDPNDPQAPVITDEYLEITSMFTASPASEVDPDWGEIPLCWYFFNFADCAPSEVTVRNSFLKATARDYEAQEWSGTEMELFGYFTANRFDYDEQYGPTNAGRTRFQVRWDIWDGSHDDRTCDATEECSDVVGSTCDEFAGLCTIPYRDREPRQIVYHSSPGLDPVFSQLNTEVVEQWNVAFRDTVNGVRYYDCVDAGGDPVACEGDWDDDLEVFVFCPNNPVLDGDPAVCGETGLAPRLGDLRYNFLYNVEHPGRGNPFGFGPAAVDPLTGEIISASAIVYEAEVRSYAAWARDVVQLLNGEIAEDDFIDGENVADWLEERDFPDEPIAWTEAEAEELASKVQLQYKDTIPYLGNGSPYGGDHLAALQQAREALRDLPASSADHGRARARLDALIGSPIEEQMINDEALLNAAAVPGSQLTEETMNLASPLRRVHQQRMRRAKEARAKRNSKRCAYFREFVDPSVEGVAADYAGWDPEDIRWELMMGLHRGTMAHELGHTLGLRHNLEGSADPFNYGEDYWALRDDGDMGPRYLDPESQDEIDAGIRKYQYSSVMDYLSRFNSDSLGARMYDRAAIKFGYGRLMEYVDSEEAAFNLDWMNETYLYNLFGYALPPLYEYDADTGEYGDLFSPHYTDFPEYYGDFNARIDVPQSWLTDFWGLEDAGWDSPHTAYMATEDGYPVVPYRFCSDEYAGSGLTCLYFDEGADLYEIPIDLVQRYERYYIFNNFGRNRLHFSADGYMYRIWDGYFDPLVGLNQWWVLSTRDMYAVEEDPATVDNYLVRYDGFGPFTLGVRESFNLFLRTIARPEPGGYAMATDSNGEEYWAPRFWDPGMELGIADGRYLSTSWDFSGGYFWDEIVARVGYFTDKTLAMEALFDPTTYFLGQDTAADLRGFRVNYGSNFFDPLMEVVGDLVSGEPTSFAPRMVDGELIYPDYADFPFESDDGVAVDPAAGFTIQFHAIVMALALLPDTYDSGFIDSTRVWYDGSGEGIDPAADSVEHRDELSGIVWVAVSMEDGDGEQQGIAARMIGQANQLKEAMELELEDDDHDEALVAALDDQLRLQRENLNLLRAVHLEMGGLDF
jgi:hypothetical protein